MEYASTHGANMAPIGIALVEPQAEIIRLNGLKKSADRSPRPASQRRKREPEPSRPAGNPAARPSATAARDKPAVTKRSTRQQPGVQAGDGTPRARRAPAAKSRPRPRQAATVATPVAMPSVDASAIPCDAGSSLDPANSCVQMRLPGDYGLRLSVLRRPGPLCHGGRSGHARRRAHGDAGDAGL